MKSIYAIETKNGVQEVEFEAAVELLLVRNEGTIREDYTEVDGKIIFQGETWLFKSVNEINKAWTK